jgi:hypothetical protein
MKPKHNVTWVGDVWDCICGFQSPFDDAAQKHYIDASPSFSGSEMDMGSEGQMPVDQVTQAEMVGRQREG